MKEKLKPWLRVLLFTLGGALIGLAYYYWIGCSSGGCAITSSLGSTMLYMGMIGFLLSGGFCSSCRGGACARPDASDGEQQS